MYKKKIKIKVKKNGWVANDKKGKQGFLQAIPQGYIARHPAYITR
jgi:hypothetical protein